jgi:choline kinase/phosphatidylglycerophosphate synthase
MAGTPGDSMIAVFLAAGRGTRMGTLTDRGPKALVPVCGVPIIVRAMRSAWDAGIRRFLVVDGYRADDLRAGVRAAVGGGRWGDVMVRHVHNPRWERGNATSLLQARPLLTDDFVLLMSDHLFDPRILRGLLDATRDTAVTLAVDARSWADDDTRVVSSDGHILRIGKGLAGAGQTDTGIFRCHPRFLDYAAQTVAAGRCELAEAVSAAAARSDAGAFHIQDLDAYVPAMRRTVPLWWIDVDTEVDRKRAQRIVIDNAGKGASDLLARFVHKPLEDRIVPLLARIGARPNKVTIAVNVLAYTVTALFALGLYLPGALLALGVGLADGLDGKLARATGRTSRVGTLEHAFDVLFELSWLVALSVSLFVRAGDGAAVILAASSIVLIAFYRSVYDLFRKEAGRSLDDAGPFERTFRRVAGRRNLYSLEILAAVIAGRPALGLWIVAVHAALTALVYGADALIRLARADRAPGGEGVLRWDVIGEEVRS